MFFDTRCLAASGWLQQEYLEKREILNAFWESRIINYSEQSVNQFKSAIINQHFPKDVIWEAKINKLFQDAVKQKINFELFFNSIKNEPLALIDEMNEVEKLISPKKYFEVEPNVTPADLAMIQGVNNA